MSEADIIANFGRVGANIDELFRRVVDTVMPVIERANTAEARQQQSQTAIDESVKTMTALEEQIQKYVKPIIQQWDSVKSSIAQYELDLGRNREAHTKFENNFAEMDRTIMALRGHVDKVTAEANGQMGALLATVGTGGSRDGGSGGRDARPLVTNRIFDNLARLSGNEDHHAIDDWYDEVERNFELLLPGSGSVLEWALKQPDPITYTMMSHEANAA